MKKNNYRRRPQSHIPARLNLLFFIVFILFVTLILRLAYLQIINGSEFVAEVRRTESTVVEGNVPRGEIYDVNHRPLVANEAKQSITYMRGKDVGTDDMAEVAEQLAQYIDMGAVSELENSEDYDLSVRDLKDYIFALDPDKVNDRLSESEKQLEGSKLYAAQLEKVSEKDLQQMDSDDMDAVAIFKEMNAAYALTNTTIKKDGVTDEEIARVSENIHRLPGVSTGVDWERTYPMDGLLRSVLGSVSSEDQGIPEEASRLYLARGYSRNDRVGLSYLEQEYEPVLKGTKSTFITETNTNGEITNQIEQYAGKKGDDLVLNVDAGFQAVVEDIATQYLQNDSRGLNNQIYIVATDPRDGAVLSLVGKRVNLETGEIEDDALGTFTQNFEAGSVVKGATVLAAYMDGVLDSSNNVMTDEPLYIAGTPPIRSVYNPDGTEVEDDISALEVSSNVYMAKLAMRMGGLDSFENGNIVDIDAEATLAKMRNYFEQMGLGVKTGIDLPGEQTGFKGEVESPGQVMYYSFGQFDSYTPLQLAQYISTIANGGTRYELNVVSEIRRQADDQSTGVLEAQNEPTALNTLDVKPEHMERVQEGMYRVINSERGTASSYFEGAPYVAAGKTGTAEALYYGDHQDRRGEKTNNRLFVGYAPYDNPQVAISVVIPYLPAAGYDPAVNEVARQVFDAYFQVGDYENLNQLMAANYPILDEEGQPVEVPITEDEEDEDSEQNADEENAEKEVRE